MHSRTRSWRSTWCWHNYGPAPPAPAWLRAVKTWLFTGNLVAKFGLLILIIGIGFDSAGGG